MILAILIALASFFAGLFADFHFKTKRVMRAKDILEAKAERCRDAVSEAGKDMDTVRRTLGEMASGGGLSAETETQFRSLLKKVDGFTADLDRVRREIERRKND